MEHGVGTVTRFERKRGYGFIKPADGGKPLFVHYLDICSADKWPSLEKGMTVEYDLDEDGETGKMRATNVTAEGGAEIQVEAQDKPRQYSKFQIKGTVKFFSRKGYGFITADDAINWPEKLPAGSDLYVSREDIVVEDGASAGLVRDMRVKFKVYKLEGEPSLRAGEVHAEDGTPVVYTPREFDPEKKAKMVKKLSLKKKGNKGGSKGGSKDGGVKSGRRNRGANQDDAFEAAYQKGLAKGKAKASGKGNQGGKAAGAKGVQKTIQKSQPATTAIGAPSGGKQSKSPGLGGKGGDKRSAKGKGKGK